MIVPNRIIEAVAEAYGFTYRDVKGKKRGQALSEARGIALHLCNKWSRRSIQETATLFGQEHSSACSAIKKVTKLQKTDLQINTIIKQIEQQLGV